ncbi:cytochrome-c peroxidase [Aurantibacter crassamenti]|uniref:cytochrome-c peroxidase n=1 Tax=Aurantibacter crassamenti TaxID=1837375 RepID=UPI0019396453|nr:cytochrome c peroxidase [Aurantibacter crassamenti]MBM1106178.1 cytochrome-c peroxidase [Aurantibacter crassamenti]
MFKIRFIIGVSIAFLIIGCKNANEKASDEAALKKRKIALLNRVSALPLLVKSPDKNEFSDEKAALGKLLFYDPILSGDKDVACVTCHHPNTGYAEFLDLSIGPNASGLGSRRRFKSPNDIPFVKRNAQTILNSAFNGIDVNNRYDPEKASMFWDERVKSLEMQALEPIRALEEMRGNNFSEDKILNVVIDRLKSIPEYRELFDTAFDSVNAITIANLSKAIAAFERTLVANNSRFDKYMRGDKDAIHISEKDGFELFKSVGCINCHNGPMFSDYLPHVLGVPRNNKLSEIDKGIQDTFAFRTPSLRNLRFTAPYMHNGSLTTLKRVLEFYEDIANGKERNADVPAEKFDPLVHELKLSVKEMSLIISFLNTLNDEEFDKEIPEAVPSGLTVGGNIN